jgi:hypothetical protein
MLHINLYKEISIQVIDNLAIFTNLKDVRILNIKLAVLRELLLSIDEQANAVTIVNVEDQDLF